jgi:hypothetical protein
VHEDDFGTGSDAAARAQTRQSCECFAGVGCIAEGPLFTRHGPARGSSTQRIERGGDGEHPTGNRGARVCEVVSSSNGLSPPRRPYTRLTQPSGLLTIAIPFQCGVELGESLLDACDLHRLSHAADDRRQSRASLVFISRSAGRRQDGVVRSLEIGGLSDDRRIDLDGQSGQDAAKQATERAILALRQMDQVCFQSVRRIRSGSSPRARRGASPDVRRGMGSSTKGA